MNNNNSINISIEEEDGSVNINNTSNWMPNHEISREEYHHATTNDVSNEHHNHVNNYPRLNEFLSRHEANTATVRTGTTRLSRIWHDIFYFNRSINNNNRRTSQHLQSGQTETTQPNGSLNIQMNILGNVDPLLYDERVDLRLHTNINNIRSNSRNAIQNIASRVNSDGNRIRHHGENTESHASTTTSNSFINGNLDGITPDMNNMINVQIPEVGLNIATPLFNYLPFMCILLLKFVYDNAGNICDLIILQGIVHIMNRSLCKQIGQFSQKSYWILSRNICIILIVITLRFLFATIKPNISILPAPFTLHLSTINLHRYHNNTTTPVSTIIRREGLEIQVIRHEHMHYPIDEPFFNIITSILRQLKNDEVIITKSISLINLLNYVAVNDLILKLVTQLLKNVITMMPKVIINYKKRAQLYASIEYTSQFYRALVPITQWLSYLNGFSMDNSEEMVQTILFSLFYIVLKLLELFERSKSLIRSFRFLFFFTTMDRKPTNEELEDTGECPICHDDLKHPIALQCNHIFCSDCVKTWFKSKQTCPICRREVSDNPAFQNGATTYLYQLC